jgi:hypothetical protein
MKVQKGFIVFVLSVSVLFFSGCDLIAGIFGGDEDVQRSVSGNLVIQRSTTTTTSGNGDYYQFNMQIIPHLMPGK